LQIEAEISRLDAAHECPLRDVEAFDASTCIARQCLAARIHGTWVT
jgi:hypothetical protein